ncbi:hypothetical protein B0H19DRAFT_1264096 [Mycena capillaripes]|nr:hypothetical protein B0H19DRAFT_1264096 [Mycena capillaripes]
MSYHENMPRAWNTPEINLTEANLPPIFGRQESSHPAWNIPEVDLPPSFNRRVVSHPQPQPQPNPFSTGSLIEALAAPPTASRNSPARPIRPRAGAHKHHSPSRTRHPSAPSRQEEAARAAAVAAMHQALSVQQGPSRHQVRDSRWSLPASQEIYVLQWQFSLSKYRRFPKAGLFIEDVE